jgi:hypothetical protein
VFSIRYSAIVNPSGRLSRRALDDSAIQVEDGVSVPQRTDGGRRGGTLETCRDEDGEHLVVGSRRYSFPSAACASCCFSSAGTGRLAAPSRASSCHSCSSPAQTATVQKAFTQNASSVHPEDAAQAFRTRLRADD